ncbi:MAG: hypothetical protein CVU97_05530 [Firmicutes bacterium HGW-Firmicutes-21]|nr:MAG: hypothetical protein CVU97_05530 [Firmicutes bacterium HGW-Firmicutes-21]
MKRKAFLTLIFILSLVFSTASLLPTGAVWEGAKPTGEELINREEYVPGEIIVAMKIEVSGVYRTAATPEDVFPDLNAKEIKKLSYHPLVDVSPYPVAPDPENHMVNLDNYRDMYLIKLYAESDMAAVLDLLNSREDVEAAEPNYIISFDSVEDIYGIRPAYSKGDLNGDGQVNSVDYLMLKRICLGTFKPTSGQLFASDINDDGAVTSADYLMIKRFFNRTHYFLPTLPKPQIPLNDEQIETIKADYEKFYKENIEKSKAFNIEYYKSLFGENYAEYLPDFDIYIGKYYGPYSGCYALFISDWNSCYTQAIRDEYIAGYRFRFSDGQLLMVYCDSAFVEINTAYNTGIITKDDVRDLSWYFRPNRSY